MAITITKPTVGGSEDSWGTQINTALDTIVDAANGTSGTMAPNLSTLTINGTDVTATAVELNYMDGVTSDVQTQINTAMPSGGIIMWSGSVASIPSGWVLCNGSNGTPNLQDRFVVGAGSAYGVGATGGSKDAIVVAHSHTASTNTVGDHTHANYYTNGSFGDAGSGVPLSDFTGTQAAGQTGWLTSGAGSHSHSVTVNSAGSSGTNANLPPYYALAYIMKL